MQVKGYDSEVSVDLVMPAAFPPGALFVAQAREYIDAPTVLLTLSTALGTISLDAAVIEGTGVRQTMRLKFPGDATRNLAVKTIVLDVVRVDVAPAHHLGFRLSIDWDRPCTRL